MTKEQFNKLKVGDIVEYNRDDVLTGCQFKITKLSGSRVEGTVVKEGQGSTSSYYKNGGGISSCREYLALVSGEGDAPKAFTVLELNVQEATVLHRLLRSVGGDETGSVRKFVASISTKLGYKFPKFNFLDSFQFFEFDKYIHSKLTLEELDSILIGKGLLKAPEKPSAPARHKLKGPDGKWAPKNYRVINYPCSKTGEMKKRHVLWGEFVKGTAGTNVHVEEWCADSKKWCPKTYSLAKVGVAE